MAETLSIRTTDALLGRLQVAQLTVKVYEVLSLRSAIRIAKAIGLTVDELYQRATEED